MSAISSNLAAIIDGLKARNADPAEDPGKALKRLSLPGKAHASYVDVVHFGVTDLAVVARQLDDERQNLESASRQAGDAAAALTKMEEILKEATDLITANVNGASRGRRRSNQRKVDQLLAELDETAAAASEANPELFGGNTTLSAGNKSVDIPEISRDALGAAVVNGRAVNLGDVVRGGALDSSRGRTAAEGARKALLRAAETATSLRERMAEFQQEDVRPRLGDVANAVAGLFNDADNLGSSDAAIELARELRDITLASSTAAVAIGADTWDRERVLELLT